MAAELTSEVTAPIIGPTEAPPEADQLARLPRLARHTITLADGHEVTLAVCGRGVPLVVVHGFTAEGILYAQTLSRLVDMGFKVIAIDTAGHGGTQGLPTGGGSLEEYTRLLGRILDDLGIKRAVLAGHSMGGRLVTELAANEPDRAVAVLLLDAIVGDTWDRMVNLFRFAPPLLAALGIALAVDTISTVPVLRDPVQARKLGKLVAPTLIGHVRRPWRLMGPAVSIIRSRGSRWMLQKLRQERIPVFAIHGSHDYVVPLSTARSAARRADGDLVVVHRAMHSWLLRDPETLPAIVHELMKRRLGTAILKSLLDAGVDPNGATDDEIEAVFFAPGARVLALTPPLVDSDVSALHRKPKYRFTISRD